MLIQRRLNWIAIGITLSLVLPLLGTAVSKVFFPDSQFANLPIHSLVEACGGLMAIAIAGILVVERPRKEQNSHYHWMAAALSGMGVLDLFHAAVKTGNNFVWLHSTATFVGGFLFAFVWLGSRGLKGRAAGHFPWWILGLTCAFGIASCVFTPLIPAMLVDDKFTLSARGLNISGGIGFLVAGVFFVRRFYQRQKLEDWLFSAHTLLFGAAGILFEASELWDPAWWWWHILRMVAYLAALAFAVRAYLDAENEVIAVNRRLNEINRNLDQTVEFRTAELSHERFLLHTLLDHLPDAIYFKDLEGKFTRVSRALADQIGCEPQEVIGKSDEDFFPEDYAAEARADEQELIRSGRPLIGKEENPHWVEDSESWVSTTKVPLPNEEGRIIGTIGISHDITAQKQSEANFRRVIDSAPNPLVVIDDKGRIELVNAAAQRLFGYEKAELIGQPVEILVPDRFRGEQMTQRRPFLRTFLARVLGREGQFFIRRKDGSEFPVEIGLNRVRLSDRTDLLASVFDVTARKQAEEALVGAKQAAESANRAKSEFLANMSHEIRTPMNGVIGMTDLLMRTEINAQQREFLGTLHDSANLLLGLLNDILDLSKIEAGRLHLEHVDFSLSDCVARSTRTLLSAAEEKGLELICRVSPDLPHWLRGDPGRLRQVLMNLIGNAIKFTDDGEVFVDFDLESQLDHGHDRPAHPQADLDSTGRVRLYVSIRDTGIGISANEQRRIFKAFEQAESSTTRRFGGTGLGLSISSQLVAMMNGQIGVNSEPGGGTTFFFTAEFDIGVEPARDPRPDLELTEGLRVLVVDDNATNRRILEELLVHWRMNAVLVENARQGIAAFRQSIDDGQPFRLVLLDHNMPDMSGLELAQQLRPLEEWRQCAVLVLSSSLRPEERKNMNQWGISAFMNKPIIASELLDEILIQIGRTRHHPPDSLPSPDFASGSDEGHVAANRKRILLVEDNRTNQVVTQALLNLEGHEHVLAENGEEALKALDHESFDLVLMDMQMPVMDGREAIRRIRQREQETQNHQNIVAVTAEAMVGDREKCIAAGADDYLSKPLTADRLHRMLQRFPSASAPPSTAGTDHESGRKDDHSVS